MAEQTNMVDLQSLMYDPCGQTERGEEMNEFDAIRILNGLFGVESCEKNSARENKLRFMLLEKIGYKPKKIIQNENVTIVLWNDGTKTVIKGQGDDLFAAFCICFAKKYCHGSTVLNQLFDCAEVKK